MTARTFLLRLAACLCIASLTACGFQLRGPKPLAFKTIYLGINPYSELNAALKRQIHTSGTTEAVAAATEAEVMLQVANDSQEKVILSLATDGTVREYQLRRSFSFRVQDRKGREVLSLAQINLTRDMTFSDNVRLAKDQEETQLYRDMEDDLVQQIMRRLAAIRPSAP
ncbi:LPS assembly lipoprotein LptE [Uliginosibacterium sediminicola]|uniref:LPS-assembly lipoprotein LptE n=1 Tax=Uliginosibacterium sediminicola TaxID=2024550 RepID=A0ABU9YWH4_9RHOO